MLENKKAGRHEAHYSRYIMSWLHVGGKIYPSDVNFRHWLLSEGLTEDEISDITTMAMCGKLELEETAKEYVHRKQ